MKRHITKYSSFGRLTCALVAVATLLVAPTTGSAQVDFTSYVSLGDSLTMGISSAGLVETVQNQSYPLLLKQQATGSAADFEQPLAGLPGVPPPLTLRGLSPLILTPDAGLGALTNLALPRPYDNLGVSGANVSDTLNTVTDMGGAHDIALRGLGTALQQAVSLSPTFVTLWIGNNDVLGAATTGLVIDGVTLTTLASFEADYRAVATTLAGTGAQMAVATIPSVTAIPFVTTVPPVLVDPVTSQPVLVDGATVALIGPNGPLALNDRVLLTATTFLNAGTGIPVAFGGNGNPLPDQVVLSAAEVNTIEARRGAFNDVIRTVAGEIGAAVADQAAAFANIVANPLEVGGAEFTTEFLTGGLFSFDGVHPTGIGYAVAANVFIDAINDTFGAEIPRASLFQAAFAETRNQLHPQSAAAESDFVFSKKADKALRWALGMPSNKRLKQLEREQDEGTPGVPDVPVAPAGPTPGAGGPGGPDIGFGLTPAGGQPGFIGDDDRPRGKKPMVR